MNRMRARREELRVEFSQHHVAKLAGIPQAKISLIERELVDPTPDEQGRIAKALQCTVPELWPNFEGVDCPYCASPLMEISDRSSVQRHWRCVSLKDVRTA